VLHWLLIVSSVFVLGLAHAASVFAVEPAEKESNMINSQYRSHSKTKLFLSSAFFTMWTVATSVVAGALSA
jgi:hypothetical protein